MLSTVLGTMLGLVMGYLGGIVDIVVGRLVEAALALPVVIVAFLFIVALGPSPLTIIVVIGLVFTLLIARTVRSTVLVESQLDYLAAARLLGEKSLGIMFIEVLPNVVPAILVEFTVRLGYAIFTVATLSFLGFGVQPPTPDWGADIAHNYVTLRRRLLVDDAVPGAGHRLPGDRDQPGHRLDRAGARVMTATDASAAAGRPRRRRAHAVRSSTWMSRTRCAARTGGPCGTSRSRSGGANPTGWSASPGPASPPWRWR